MRLAAADIGYGFCGHHRVRVDRVCTAFWGVLHGWRLPCLRFNYPPQRWVCVGISLIVTA
jgi:hypothetical protein